MTRRAKRAKKAAAEPKGTGARRGKSSSSALGSAEPFFRPFTKLKVEKPAAKNAAAKSAAAKSAAAKPAAPGGGPAKTTAKIEASPSSSRKGKDGRAPEAAEALDPQPVDPETFAIYMAGVRMLEQHSTRIPKTANRLERAAPGSLPTSDLDAPARAQMRSLVTDGIRFESVDDGERLEGRRIDVEPREVRRLRRGAYAVDGKLDLHGMGLDEAREAVSAFVKKRSSDGDRVIVIIHGKGTHSPRGHGVLRGEIGAWLSDGRAARHVAAFATAPETMGGTGALLVLLAR